MAAISAAIYSQPIKFNNNWKWTIRMANFFTCGMETMETDRQAGKTAKTTTIHRTATGIRANIVDMNCGAPGVSLSNYGQQSVSLSVAIEPA